MKKIECVAILGYGTSSCLVNKSLVDENLKASQFEDEPITIKSFNDDLGKNYPIVENRNKFFDKPKRNYRK